MFSTKHGPIVMSIRGRGRGRIAPARRVSSQRLQKRQRQAGSTPRDCVEGIPGWDEGGLQAGRTPTHAGGSRGSEVWEWTQAPRLQRILRPLTRLGISAAQRGRDSSDWPVGGGSSSSSGILSGLLVVTRSVDGRRPSACLIFDRKGAAQGPVLRHQRPHVAAPTKVGTWMYYCRSALSGLPRPKNRCRLEAS